MGDGPNTYGYAQQNPLTYSDPTGQFAIGLFIPAFIGVGAGTTCIATNCGQGFADAVENLIDNIFHQNSSSGDDPENCPVDKGLGLGVGTGSPNGFDPDEDPDKDLTKQQKKSIRSLEKQIRKHEQKIQQFRQNPTVRPGMENQPAHVIRAQQQARIRHLETEIRTFNSNISKIRRGIL